ncbi:MAG: multidrug efflux SMR transporter [Myxococcota bacterium]
MSWMLVVVAGLLEVAWSVGLRYTAGFTKPLPSLLTGGAIVASMWLLGLATKSLPIGTAYSVWVGIGAVGSTVLGAVCFDEPLTSLRGLFLTLLVAALVGLKVTGSAH